jgi:hypothetical protein
MGLAGPSSEDRDGHSARHGQKASSTVRQNGHATQARITSAPLSSRGRDQGAVAVVEGADTPLAQPAVTDTGRQAHQLGQGLALLAHPVDPGAAAPA